MVKRLLLLAFLWVSACERDLDAPIFLTGVVLDDAGEPTPGKTVRLEGAPPWDSPPDEPWRSIATTTTDDDGRYTFAASQGALYPGDGRTIARVFVDDDGDDVFFSASYDAELPPLEPWDAKFAINAAGASFAPAPPREDETSSAHALELVSGTEVLWREWVDGATTLPLPSVSSEDLPDSSWRVRAWRNGKRVYAYVRANGSWIDWTARSSSRSIAAVDVDRTVPVSRDRPCFVDDRPLQGCPVTDGRMPSVSLPVDEKHGYPPRRIAILLDAPQRVSSVVVRGLMSWSLGEVIVEGVTAGGETVELGRVVVDANGDGFSLDGAREERWARVVVESSEPVERVVVRGSAEGEPAYLAAVREISVF